MPERELVCGMRPTRIGCVCDEVDRQPGGDCALEFGQSAGFEPEQDREGNQVAL
jgi:hypothetical protein